MNTNTLAGLALTILSVNIIPATVVTNRIRGSGQAPNIKSFGTNRAALVQSVQEFQRTNSVMVIRTNAAKTNWLLGVTTPDGQQIPMLFAIPQPPLPPQLTPK